MVLLLIAAMVLPGRPVQAAGLTGPSLSASSAILVDGKTGQILYGRDIRGEFYPASITKIMTAYLGITRGWHDTVTVSNAAASQIGSSCYLRPGETDTMPQIVTCMMLVSGNDAAYAVAQTVSGQVSRFVNLMNQTARRWHAPGIHFVNPNGLPNPHHVVSALGMAIIAEHAMQNPIFRRIVRTHETALPPDPKPRVYYNQNRLLYTYPGAIGIKIGYTIEADETIVAAAKRHGVYLIAVLLHDTPAGLWPDAANLLSWGFRHFQPEPLVRAGQSLGTVRVGQRRIAVVASRDVNVLVAPGQARPALATRVTPDRSLGNRAISRGQPVGRAALWADGQKLATVSLLAARAVPPLPPAIHWRWPWLAVPVAIFLLLAGSPRRPRTGRLFRGEIRGKDG